MAWMQAGSPDANDIRREIEVLKERLRIAKEERQANRLAKGQQPEPPEKFLEPVLSAVLAERLTPLLKFATSVGSLLADGNAVPIDLKNFDKFRTDIALLQMSTVSKYCAIGKAGSHLLKLFEEYCSGSVENRTAARGVYYSLSMASILDDEFTEMREQVKRYRQSKGHVEPDYESIEKQAEALKADEVRFNEVYEKALAHYKAIESELDEPAYNQFW